MAGSLDPLISSSSVRAAGATPVPCEQLSWVSASGSWNKTRSEAPASIGVASPPRRCCTPQKWRTRCAMAANSAFMPPSTKLILPGGVLRRQRGQRIYKGVSGLLNVWWHHRCARRRPADRSRQAPSRRCQEETHAAPHLVLATGSYPRSLPGLDVDGAKILNSEHALRLDRLPASAIVLGGGVIGVEFASIWRSFGVDVTVLKLSPGSCPEKTRASPRHWNGPSADARSRSSPTAALAACQTTESGVRAELADGQVLEAELMLVAVGRGPLTADLGYQEAGIDLDDGFVRVNERLGDLDPGVYAVGDVVRGLQLAHRGFAQGIFVAEEIAHRAGVLDRAPTAIADAQIPRVTYCDPEIASGGTDRRSSAHPLWRCGNVQLRPRRKWQVAHPQDSGFCQARTTAAWSGRRSSHDRCAGQRARIRGAADHQLGCLPRGCRWPDPPAPHAKRSTRRGTPSPRGQAATRSQLAARSHAKALARGRTVRTSNRPARRGGPAEARLWPNRHRRGPIEFRRATTATPGPTEHQHDKGVLSSHVDLCNPPSTR